MLPRGSFRFQACDQNIVPEITIPDLNVPQLPVRRVRGRVSPTVRRALHFHPGLVVGTTMAPEKSIIDEPRSSGDSERNIDLTAPIHQNGVKDHVSDSISIGHLNGSGDPIQILQRELDITREEKEKLATQYNNLLAKLTQMRTTLGTKLKQDAVRSPI